MQISVFSILNSRSHSFYTFNFWNNPINTTEFLTSGIENNENFNQKDVSIGMKRVVNVIKYTIVSIWAGENYGFVISASKHRKILTKDWTNNIISTIPVLRKM